MTTFFSLTLRAVDGGSPSLTGSAVLTVFVTDADDQPVTFDPDSYSTSIFENSAIGTTVTTVTANDPDTVVSNPITYSLAEGTEVPFAVSSRGGAITVAAELDRETMDQFVFQVVASNSPGLSATAMVTVAILDVNDVAPSFPGAPFQFLILESESVGTTVGEVLAVVDGDLGEAGMISGYSIQPSVPEFTINASGVISLAAGIDYESLQEYNLTIVATDGGSPSLSGSTQVEILVTDANDNSPVFSDDSLSVAISENTTAGSAVFVLVATDADSGTNAEILYSLSPAETPFAVHPSSGVVNVTGDLSLQTYILQATATDGGTPPLSSMATLSIMVTDANEPPAFTLDVFAAELSEGAPVGSMIAQVVAMDPDAGDNAEITYSILPQDVFTIDAMSGAVTLAMSLDFESVTSYTRTLIASDSGVPSLTASSTLLVTVLDFNDNAPQFSEDVYIIFLPENSPPSILLTVNATDADSASNAEITYSIASSPSSSLFTIAPTTGEVASLTPLDFEAAQRFDLVIQARDGGSPTMSSSASLIVFITDQDDNAPIFDTNLYSVQVNENTSIGEVLLRVRATDLDSGTNAEIAYSLVNASILPFTIDPTSGNVSLNTPGLDRETVDYYLLTVEAANPSSSTFTATSLVEVGVLDTNDNSPQFDSLTLAFSIAESASPGTPIGTVLASDRDTDENAIVSYFIEPPSPLVAIDTQSGELTVTQALDFESNPLIEVNVTAVDSGSPQLSSIAMVSIQLDDVNDVTPTLSIFPSSFVFLEDSGMTRIGSGIVISDPDSHPIVQATVKLTSADGSSPPPSGDFILLDTASGDALGLSLSASSTCINVTGDGSVTTYTSFLSQLQFGSTASEPEGGSRSVQVQVFDEDFASDIGTISVSVQTVNDNPPVLDLNPVTEGLDTQVTFEEEGFFVFLVEQASLSDPDGNQIQSITVSLTNPRDGSLEELSGFPIGGVSVETVNSSLVILVGPSSPAAFELALQSVSYINHADEPQDIQTPRLISFVAHDGIFTSQTAIATVVIQSVNDPPELRLGSTRDIVLVYSEDTPSLPLVTDDFLLLDDDSEHLSLVTITVANFQPGVDRFNYSTEGTNVTAEFLSGTLLLSGPAPPSDFASVLQTVLYINTFVETDQFDQLEGGQIIEFVANDGSDSSETASAFITFSGINDPPLLDLNGMEPGRDFMSTFREGDSSVAVVSPQLTITDTDSNVLSSATAQLSGTSDQLETLLVTDVPEPLSFTYNPSNQILSLTGSGDVTMYEQALRSLIYMNSDPEPSPGPRTVVITVDDGEAISTPATATVLVVSVNDPPTLSFQPSEAVFTEGGPPVALVQAGSVLVADVDDPTLTSLTVTITNALDGTAEIINASSPTASLEISLLAIGNALTYTISFSPSSLGSPEDYADVVSTLAYANTAPEPVDAIRIINVSVFDGASSSEVVTVALGIILVNDNSPVFEQRVVETSVSESRGAGTSIFQAVATDLDADTVITYSVLNSTDHFSINGSTGLITLSESLDRETLATFTLVLQASDGINLDQQLLNVFVIDANDNPPVFLQEVYSTFLSESTPVGSSVVQVEASDLDEGINSDITYSIRSGNQAGTFTINGTSGVLVTAVTLDFEATESYTLVVQAQDGGIPRLTGTAVVVVTVTDAVDNPPVFDPTSDIITVTENTQTGVVLYTATATDADVEDQIVYSLLGETDQFAVLASGEVTLTQPLDREAVESHLIRIEASDGVFNSTFQLTIVVGDVDDNAPVFEQDEYFVTVPENITFGTEILQLVTSDPDIGTNAGAQYEIIGGDSTNRFTIAAISANTSTITVTGALDRESQDRYELSVVARSPLDPSLNDTAVVRITVSDVNESPEFDAQIYQFSVLENVTVGTVIAAVQANDEDLGVNSELSYMLSSATPPGSFQVTLEGDVVLARQLDRENVTEFQLVVTAEDNGMPRLSAMTIVSLTVLDINDNPPVFADSVKTTTLPENTPLDTQVITILAEDSDEGSNQEIVYSIQSDSFTIGPQTGELRTAALFDFEEVNPTTQVVVVTATDQGNPPLSSNTTILVSIEDVNEFSPVFDQTEYTAAVNENLPIFTSVLQVRASDGDSGTAGVIEYSLSGTQPFGINSTSGEVYTTAAIDREGGPSSYFFTVQVSNVLVSPSLPSTATIAVEILDVNDNPPVFTQERYTAAILVTAGVGSTVLTVTASDLDAGSNAMIQYSLEDHSSHFMISEANGTITLIAPFNTTAEFVLTAFAADQGSPQLSANATVTVTVTHAVGVKFSQTGAGFLLQGAAGSVQDFGLFADSPAGSTGRIAASLGGVTVEEDYETALPEAVSVVGFVLTEEVWPELPDARVLVSVRGELGEVRSEGVGVVLMVDPDDALRAAADITIRVRVCMSVLRTET